ncbi:MAG: hypothetical protein ABW065_01150 [Solirubrobacterales bacterium]
MATAFRFEYISEAGYLANLGAGRDGFFAAGRVPVPDGSAGKGSDVGVARQAAGLLQETSYLYRVVASNVGGTIAGSARRMTTRGGGGPLALLDGRGWEMVSPVDKDGGEVQGPGGAAGGGVLQAAAQGGAVTFSSVSSYASGGQGAPTGSQYVSRRTSGGWVTENVTPPAYAGAYGEEPEGVPYQLFAPDLARGLLTGIAGLPPPGTGAPAGYANYYLRDAGGSFAAMVTQGDVALLSPPPTEFQLAFAGASPDLRHVALSTCAALTGDATEVPSGSGCDSLEPNLYRWSASGLRLVNLLPGDSTGTTPAQLAAQSGAISADGSRVYWLQGQNLYLREGARTVPIDSLGAQGAFQAATPDGALAFFTKDDEHLYEYVAGLEATLDLTPSGGVKGMLGTAADGSRAYFATAAGIFLVQGAAVTPVGAAPDSENFPPSTGAARVSADGTRLLFVSKAELTPYDNTDAATGEPDAEVYLYDATAAGLACISCNPTGERPTGSASVPGAVANGKGVGATRAYKPRVLSADGRRAFFETPDSLVLQDTNHASDVYEWEAGGTGSCARPQGCLQLISSGRSPGGASFVDASADGGDVFFLTDGSLVKPDPGAIDLYDAREGGGFPEPLTAIPCEEDACQPLPPPPDDPSPGSLVPSTGNPPVHFPRAKKAKKHRRKRGVGKKRRHRGRSSHARRTAHVGGPARGRR